MDKLAAFLARKIALDKGAFVMGVDHLGWEAACKRESITDGRNH